MSNFDGRKVGASGILVGRGEKMGDPSDPPVMQDKKLYEKLLGLSAPWSVQEVDLQVKKLKVTLKLTHQPLRIGTPERSL